MEFPIPEPLKAEHEALHAELARARDAGGRTGEAAKDVAKTLHPHFVREEQIAMPPLALLGALAADKITPEMADVLSMTDRLEAELPHMLEQHGAIVAALGRLESAARDQLARIEETVARAAAEAERIGLVDRVIPHDKLMDEVMTLATRIANNPYLSVRHAKQLVKFYWNANRSDEGWRREFEGIQEITRTKDCHEGIRAFLEKRKPEFRGPYYDNWPFGDDDK